MLQGNVKVALIYDCKRKVPWLEDFSGGVGLRVPKRVDIVNPLHDWWKHKSQNTNEKEDSLGDGIHIEVPSPLELPHLKSTRERG